MMYDEIYVATDANNQPLNPNSSQVENQNRLDEMEGDYIEVAYDYKIENNTSDAQYNQDLEKEYKKMGKRLFEVAQGRYKGAFGLYKATKVNGVYQWECVELTN